MLKSFHPNYFPKCDQMTKDDFFYETPFHQELFSTHSYSLNVAIQGNLTYKIKL